MRIWAIGDLHLPGGDKKPMDIFGAHWKNHFERICADWQEKVSDEDAVLIPGDISWAMNLNQALDDLRAIGELPGTILLLKGNHDYWWSSLTQLRAQLPPRMYAIQNDSVVLESTVVAGTRGWTLPGSPQEDDKNLKIYNREVQRLELSLKQAASRAEGRPILAMMHYPPVTPDMIRNGIGTGFADLLTAYGVTTCVYGHLHGASIQNAFAGLYNGVEYTLVSCDALGFTLKEIPLE